MKMEWKNDSRQYTSGYVLYLGKHRVASCWWDGARTHEAGQVVVTICLPIGNATGSNLKQHFVNFEAAKAAAEEAVLKWFREALGEPVYGLRNDQGYWVGIWNERSIAESMLDKGNPAHGERIVELYALPSKEEGDE